MKQTSQFLAAAKQCLRAKGLTYRDVAEALDLSEVSIKRLFSEESFSLQRLEAVCDLMDITLFDLARMANQDGSEASSVLTLEQEKVLAANQNLFRVFYLLCNGYALGGIRKKLGIEKPALTRLLLELDRLRLIDLQPRDRVVLRTARTIHWRKGGPVRSKYEEQVKQEFLNASFSRSGESLTFETAELSEASMQVMERRIAKLNREFQQLAEVDLVLHPDERQSVGLLAGFRPWVFSLMDE